MQLKDLVPFGRKNKDLASYHDIFSNFRRELDSIFNKAFSSTAEATEIRLDVKNEGDKIIILADVPGFNKKDLSLSLDGNLLTIKAEKHEEKEEKGEDFYLKERSSGTLLRSLQLPFHAQQDSVQAQLEQGTLKITVPKSNKTEDQAKQITIK